MAEDLKAKDQKRKMQKLIEQSTDWAIDQLENGIFDTKQRIVMAILPRAVPQNIDLKDITERSQNEFTDDEKRIAAQILLGRVSSATWPVSVGRKPISLDIVQSDSEREE